MSDEWQRCGNCSFPMGPEERADEGRRVCRDCEETYAMRPDEVYR